MITPVADYTVDLVTDAGGGGDGTGVTPNWINVSLHATSGSGTLASPWVGWETISWNGGQPYYFPQGVYASAVNPLWSDITGLTLLGDSSVSTVLVYTGGAGRAWQFLNTTYLTRRNLRIENLQFQGNVAGTTTDVLYFLDCHNGKLYNIKTMNGTDTGLRFAGGVTNHVENFSHSVHETGVVTYAQHGLLIESGDGGFPMTDSVFVNLNIDGTLDSGMQLNDATYCTFISGTVEDCFKGIYFGGSQTCWANSFVGMDLEGITAGDAFNFGGGTFANAILGGQTIQAIRFPSSAVGNSIHGGLHNVVTIESGAVANTVAGICYNNDSGALTDAGTRSRIYSAHDLTNNTEPKDVLVAGAARGLSSFANNGAAITGGLAAGDLYTITGSDPLQVAVVF